MVVVTMVAELMLFLTMCPPVIHEEDGDQRGAQRNPQHTKRFFALRLWHACFQHAFVKRFVQFHALHHCLSSAWHLEFSVAGFAGANSFLAFDVPDKCLHTCTALHPFGTKVESSHTPLAQNSAVWWCSHSQNVSACYAQHLRVTTAPEYSLSSSFLVPHCETHDFGGKL